jgi:hypothetical protein
MATPALQADYLFVGPLIVDRLRATVPQIAPTDVMRIEELAQAGTGQAARGPLAYVLWDGEQFPQAQGQAMQGAAQQAVQLWTVVVQVRNASQVQDDARNTSAGPLLSAVHLALAGWKPEGAVHALHRVPGHKPNYQPNSGLYPLTFGIALHL